MKYANKIHNKYIILGWFSICKSVSKLKYILVSVKKPAKRVTVVLGHKHSTEKQLKQIMIFWVLILCGITDHYYI